MGTKENRSVRDEQLRFETLLADLSARFISLPAHQVDSVIIDAQRRVCECLGFDMSVLWQWESDNPSICQMTHFYRPDGGPPAPDRMNAAEYCPWFLGQVHSGNVVAVSSIDSLPKEAARDVETWRHFGVKTAINVPLSIGGGAPFGVISFNDMTREREWPELLVKRIELVAHIFANTLVRRRYEDELHESGERLTMATAAAGAGLWVLDPGSTRFWINKKIAELFGLPPVDTLDVEQFIAMVYPEDRRLIRKTINEAFDSEAMTTVEYRIVRPDGQVCWMRTRGRPSAAADSEAFHLMGITMDVTDQKQSELERNELRLEIAHITRVSMLGELSASMAHELNQPLAAILSNAQAARRFLASPNPDMKEIHEILDDIVKDDKRAGEVIHRLRSLVQKQDSVVAEPVDVNEILHEVMHLLHSELINRNVKHELDLMPEIPVVMAGRVEMQQVFLNLIVNAMDAMRDQPVELRHLKIKTTVTDDKVRVMVRDHGAGIPETVLPDIFRPFFTTKPQGLGMGLSISRSMVESHGGRLWVENYPGEGALFHMELPFAAEGRRDVEGGA